MLDITCLKFHFEFRLHKINTGITYPLLLLNIKISIRRLIRFRNVLRSVGPNSISNKTRSGLSHTNQQSSVARWIRYISVISARRVQPSTAYLIIKRIEIFNALCGVANARHWFASIPCNSVRDHFDCGKYTDHCRNDYGNEKRY